MSVKATAWAWDMTEVGGNDLIVLLALADQHNEQYGACWPSIEYLSDRTRLSKATVKRRIAALIDAGLVSRRSRYGNSNVYRLPLEKDMRGARRAQFEPIGDDPTKGSPVSPRRAHNCEPSKGSPSEPLTVNEPLMNRYSSEIENPRPDVEEVCGLLAGLIRDNGSKANVTGKWRNAARLLIDRDKRPLPEIKFLIRWCQDDDFWRGNILSMPKLRDQYDKLRLQSQRDKPQDKSEWNGSLYGVFS